MFKEEVEPVRLGFDGFGPSRVLARVPEWQSMPITGPRRQVRAELRLVCPAEPGVYGMLDSDNRLIYVGLSSSLQTRLLTYFTGSRVARKESRVGKRSRRLVWEVTGHEFPAMLRELELIRRFRPDFNVRGRSGRRPPGYLYLAGGEAPQFRFGTRAPAAARHVWGPLPNVGPVREAVERLNVLFRLRDCQSHIPNHFAEQRRLFRKDLAPACLRGEIGTCLAPCAGHCTRSEYHRSLRKAIALLDGRDSTPLDDLEEQMRKASVAMQFERAARLRDLYATVQDLCERLDRLRHPPQPREGVYCVTVRDGRWWYLLHDGCLKGAFPEPQTAEEKQTAAEWIERTLSDPWKRETIHHEGEFLIQSWFRRKPEELNAVRPVKEVLRACRRRVSQRLRRKPR